MNRRLEGWQLILAVLLPLLIVGAAILILLQTLGDDDSAVDTTADRVPVPTTVPTEVPQTEAVADTVEAEPVADATPTPLALPTPVPLPTAAPTATPSPTPTPAPAPTAAPAPAQPAPTSPPQQSGPTPTPTVDPSVLVITCAADGGFPETLDVGTALPELTAAVSPPEAAANLRFLWNFDNGRTTGAPNSGTVIYEAQGSYTVTLAATDTTTGVVTNVTCGTVQVGEAVGAITKVSCQVRPTNSVPWADASLTTPMAITTTWEGGALLTLQHEFRTLDPLVIIDNAESPSSTPYQFEDLDTVVRIFWRDPATGENDRISCRAFPKPTPEVVQVTPTPTPTPTP